MEQIAMLNGLGAYGENPIGDLDPRLAAARAASLRTTAVPNAYKTVPYTLGAADDKGADTDAWYKSKWVWGGAALLAAVWFYDRSRRAAGKSGILPFNGFEEPEMLRSLGKSPRRRKGRK